eukprot:scaffold3917_cov24-Tisochrysis_lutea.AAC.2
MHMNACMRVHPQNRYACCTPAGPCDFEPNLWSPLIRLERGGGLETYNAPGLAPYTTSSCLTC